MSLSPFSSSSSGSRRSAGTLALAGVTVQWPDGSTVFKDLSLTIPTGHAALVGVNGSGKTTILRLLAGALRPTAGSVTAPAAIGYVPQDVTLRDELRVDAALGIAPIRRALSRIERGEIAPELFDTVGDEWDVSDRAAATLDGLGLPTGTLDRRIGELSGGQATQVAIAAALLGRPDVLILDEPTNNLDRAARARLTATITGFAGTVVVVSHDRELLETVDAIGEVRVHPGPEQRRSVNWYGGTWSDYVAQVEVEKAAAERDVTDAKANVRRQDAEWVDTQVTLARRRRFAKKAEAEKREPKIVMGNRKRAAQVSAAKLTATQRDRREEARNDLNSAELRLREDREIRIDLPQTALPVQRHAVVTRKLVLRNGLAVDIGVRGPERIAIVGANGSGKSTLLHTLIGDITPRSGQLSVRVPAALLPQRLSLLDPQLSVVDNAHAFAPEVPATELRAALAKFLFRGTAGDRPVAALSGGELFRATFACLLLAQPAPSLLLLDEPTNSLDVASARNVVSALAGFHGAIIVASHDRVFLDELGIDRVIDLDTITTPTDETTEAATGLATPPGSRQ